MQKMRQTPLSFFLVYLTVFSFSKCELCPTGSVATYNTSLSSIGDGISIGFSVNCSTSQITFKLQGPSDKWFGIVFNSEMFGDSIIYTTGKQNENRPTALHDYYLSSGKSISSVTFDTQQDLTSIEQTTIDSDTIYLEYSRSLNTNDANDIVFTSETITFRYAFGSNLQLSYHGPGGKSSRILSVNLETGDISSKKDINALLHTIHGVLMWMSWAVLVPMTIFVARNKRFWNDINRKQWFLLHKSLGLLIILLNIAAVTIIIYAVENTQSSDHAAVPHHILGFSVIILLFLHIMLAICRPHKAVGIATESIQRRFWKFVHGVNALLILVLSNVNIISGINLKGEISLVIVHIIWISVVGVVLLFFEWKRTHHRLYSNSNSIDNDNDKDEKETDDVEMKNMDSKLMTG